MALYAPKTVAKLIELIEDLQRHRRMAGHHAPCSFCAQMLDGVATFDTKLLKPKGKA